MRPGPEQQTVGECWLTRGKQSLIRTTLQRLCDGEAFFFYKLLELSPWRSDEEILGGHVDYRQHLLERYLEIYEAICTGQQAASHRHKLHLSNLYLELVQTLTTALPRPVATLIHEQMLQLRNLHLLHTQMRMCSQLKVTSTGHTVPSPML